MTWKVKASLARKNLRLRDVAVRLERSEALVSKILSGQHKGVSLRPRIAALLGVSEPALAREIDKAKSTRRAGDIRTAGQASSGTHAA